VWAGHGDAKFCILGPQRYSKVKIVQKLKLIFLHCHAYRTSCLFCYDRSMKTLRYFILLGLLCYPAHVHAKGPFVPEVKLSGRIESLVVGVDEIDFLFSGDIEGAKGSRHYFKYTVTKLPVMVSKSYCYCDNCSQVSRGETKAATCFNTIKDEQLVIWIMPRANRSLYYDNLRKVPVTVEIAAAIIQGGTGEFKRAKPQED